MESFTDDLILHLVPIDDEVHPVVEKPCVLFVKNIKTKNIFYYVLDHQDDVISKLPSFDGPNKKWVLNKKSFQQMLPTQNLYDINLCKHLTENKILEFQEYETPAHMLVRKNIFNFKGKNKVIPLMKHYEAFQDFCLVAEKVIDKFKIDSSYEVLNGLFLNTLAETESNGIYVNQECFNNHFSSPVYDGGLVYSQYNVYTSTGRPSNRFGGVNYSALNKEDGSRECFVSRYGKEGQMLLIDFSAFHPRIISYLTKFNISVNTDIYYSLGQWYFDKQDLTNEEYSEAKTITFKQLYGGVEDKYSQVSYLASLKTFIDYHWDFFNKNGYVETPLFKRKITDKHIDHPNPPKVFNYILQATETEIGIPTLSKVNCYLKDKMTKSVLYTYDSILFDHFKEDSITELIDIMKNNNKFPVKVYTGGSYNSLVKVSS